MTDDELHRKFQEEYELSLYRQEMAALDQKRNASANSLKLARSKNTLLYHDVLSGLSRLTIPFEDADDLYYGDCPDESNWDAWMIGVINRYVEMPITSNPFKDRKRKKLYDKGYKAAERMIICFDKMAGTRKKSIKEKIFGVRP